MKLKLPGSTLDKNFRSINKKLTRGFKKLLVKWGWSHRKFELKTLSAAPTAMKGWSLTITPKIHLMSICSKTVTVEHLLSGLQ